MNLATLGIRVEGQEVARADAQLDGLAAAADKAEAATMGLSAAARGTAGPLAAMNANIVQQQRSLVLTRNAMGLTSSEGLNMGRQLSDVGVQLAMGMSPFMIAVQQGPQVFDIFQQSAIRAGTTVRAAMVATGTAVWTALAPLLPIIAALALAAGTVAAAWGIAARSVNQDAKSVQDSLGLTADQMEYLKKKGVDTGVTMGDVWTGIGTTIKRVLKESFGEEVDWAMSQWNSFLDGLTSAMHSGAKFILTTFLASYFGIRDTWRMLPGVIGSVATSAANGVVAAIEMMLNKARVGINAVILAARGLSVVSPAFALARGIPTIDEFSLGRMRDGNAGSVGQFSRAWGGAGRQAGAVAGDIMSGIGRDTVAARDARVRGGLEGYDGPAETAERTARALGAANDNAEIMDEIVGSMDLKPLEGQFWELITPLDQAATHLALIRDLAQDMAGGLSSAFGRAGDALGGLLTTLTDHRAQMAAWDADESSMLLDRAANTDALARLQAERGQAQIGVYGDLAAAARGYFDEGSTGYRVLLAIEQVYRAQQLAGMLMAMTTGQTETASSVAGSMTRGAAYMAEGAANMFARLGPWAFPAVAAMIGLLAGLGLRGGGGGGGYSPANDNEPGAASTDAVRSQSARTGASASGSQRVQVVVTADRDGMNAFVVNTAGKVAAPMAVQSGQIAAKVGQSRTEAALARRQAYTVRR